MRETKFRAWNKLNNKLETVVKIFYPEEGDNIGDVTKEVSEFCVVKEYYLLKGEYELMQYTGLHDKNGKEIWEGDIVKQMFGTGVVEWGRIGFYVVSRTKGEIYPPPLEEYSKNPLYEHMHPEVIGNIYENPELIKNQ